jgi:competence protein ComEC
MTLGDKSAMTRELRDVYAVSGASHVLALSGLHLGIIYMLLSLLIVGRRLRYVILPVVVLAIWAFVLLTGLPVSVVRAAVMISLYALLSLIHRGHFSLNALSLAALLILTVSPDSLWDVGFQLSFAAMVAILTVQPLLARPVSETYLFDRPVLRWLWGIVTVSVAAQIGTAPLIAYYFGRLPLYFLLTNLLVIPAATVIIWLVPVALLQPVAGVLLLKCVSWLNAALTLIAQRQPGASIDGLRPSVLQTLLVYDDIVSLFLIVVRYDKHP